MPDPVATGVRAGADEHEAGRDGVAPPPADGTAAALDAWLGTVEGRLAGSVRAAGPSQAATDSSRTAAATTVRERTGEVVLHIVPPSRLLVSQ